MAEKPCSLCSFKTQVLSKSFFLTMPRALSSPARSMLDSTLRGWISTLLLARGVSKLKLKTSQITSLQFHQRELGMWLFLTTREPGKCNLAGQLCVQMKDRMYFSQTTSSLAIKSLLFFFSFLFFWGGHTYGIWKFPSYRVKSEFQLPGYATATATRDLSLVCDLHHSNARSLTH